eukprot:Skav211671  [mRNA]  locus=scaffold216:105387:106229:- [translate_table: standard]
MDNLFWQLVLEHSIEQASKVSMETFIARNELVGKGQTRHETSLLQPEDGTKRSAEEDALNCSKCHKTLSKAAFTIHPLNGPTGLLPDSWHCVNSIKKVILLLWVLDVLLDQQRIGLGVDVFHSNLETIKGPSLWNLHFRRELLRQVLQNDAVTSREECQHVLHKMLLALVEAYPVLVVLCKVDLLSSPERCLMLLVHLPHLWILKGEHHKTTRVLLQHWVVLLQVLVLVRNGALLWHGCQGVVGSSLCKSFVQVTWEVDLIIPSDGSIWSNECLMRKSGN